MIVAGMHGNEPTARMELTDAGRAMIPEIPRMTDLREHKGPIVLEGTRHSPVPNCPEPRRLQGFLSANSGKGACASSGKRSRII